jgi:hypothetical protein
MALDIKSEKRSIVTRILGDKAARPKFDNIMREGKSGIVEFGGKTYRVRRALYDEDGDSLKLRNK